jgi:very-short-patch-repair endonuclease
MNRVCDVCNKNEIQKYSKSGRCASCARKKFYEDGGKNHNAGKKWNKEVKEKISNSSKGKKISDSHKKAIAIAMSRENNHFYGKQHTEETKKRMSEIRKKNIALGKINPLDSFKQMCKDAKTKGSSYELKVADFFDSIAVSYETQVNIEGKFFDFKLENNILIEVDGEYWHNYPNGTDKDKEKNEIAKRNNYKLIRIWGKEIDKVWRII